MAAAAAGGLAIALAAPAYSQVARSLGDVLRESLAEPSSPLIGRYTPEQGPGFVLDRSREIPLLRFDNNSEVWVLKPRATGRGDTNYMNDAGRVMLRATRLGGLIMFTDDRPQGVPVALRGGAQPLPAQLVMSPTTFLRRMQEALDRLERLLRRDVAIQFKTDAEAAPFVADAARLAVDAIEQTNRRPGGAAVLARLTKVVVRNGPVPTATYEPDGSLTIEVNPDLGLAGRPSSEKIRRALR